MSLIQTRAQSNPSSTAAAVPSTASTASTASAAPHAASAAQEPTAPPTRMTFGDVKKLPGWAHAVQILLTLKEQNTAAYPFVAYLEGGTGTGKTTSAIAAILAGRFADDLGRRFIICVPNVTSAFALYQTLLHLFDEQTKEMERFGVREQLQFIALRAGGITRGDADKAKLLICTTQVITNTILTDIKKGEAALRESMRSTVFCIDEAHYNTSENYFLLGLLNWLCSNTFHLSVRVVLMSATMPDFSSFEYLHADFAQQVRGVLHERRIVYLPESSDIYEHPRRFGIEPGHQLATETGRLIDRALTEVPDGTLLCFVDGDKLLSEVIKQIEGISRTTSQRLRVYGMTGSSSPSEQIAAIAAPRSGERKIIVATNVVESSITIPGVTVVVDTLIARTSMQTESGVSRLATYMISQKDAQQRAGRCGRDCPGVVYRLCSEEFFNAMNQYTPTVFFNEDYERTVLQLIKVQNPFANGPLPADHILLLRREEFETCMEKLAATDAIDNEGFCTDVGAVLSGFNLPLDLARFAAAVRAEIQDPWVRYFGAFMIALAATRRSCPSMINVPEAHKKSFACVKYIQSLFRSLFVDGTDITGAVKLALLHLCKSRRLTLAMRNTLNEKFFSQFEKVLSKIRPRLVSLDELAGNESYTALFDHIERDHDSFRRALVPLMADMFPVYTDTTRGNLFKCVREDGSNPEVESVVDTRMLSAKVGIKARIVPLSRSEITNQAGDRSMSVVMYWFKIDDPVPTVPAAAAPIPDADGFTTVTYAKPLAGAWARS